MANLDPSRNPTNPDNSAPSKPEPLARLAREEGPVPSKILYRAARRGQLPVTQVGARFYARREDVAALLTPRRLGVEAR